jgi:hypothetical protein
MLTETLKRAGCGAVLVLGLAAAPAVAEGGPSIAAATPIVFGQQEFGSTAAGAQVRDYGFGFWALNVVAGDRVTIDWEAQSGHPQLDVYAAGTTDFAVVNATAVATQRLTENGRNELVLTAPATGAMPVELSAIGTGCGCPEGRDDRGPYDFAATVRHALSVSMPRVRKLPTRGILRVGVRNPEGGLISDPGLTVTLQLKRPGAAWKTIGRAPVANSLATVTYAVPAILRHRKMTLRAVAQGLWFTSRSSAIETVNT